MRKRRVITLILLGVFLAGLSLLLYPSVSSYWNSITQSKAIVDYDTIVKSLSPKDNTAYFERAEECNSELKALSFPLMEYQQISGYDDCLNAAGNGIIGYIDIDKIQVKLPIYHGTDPSILNHACGHIQGSRDAFIIDRLIVTPVVAMPIILLLILYVCFKPAKRKLPINDEGELI